LTPRLCAVILKDLRMWLSAFRKLKFSEQRGCAGGPWLLGLRVRIEES